MSRTTVTPDQFQTFGDLLKYLRKREGLTQRDLSIVVGYSDTQISRMEKNTRVPDTTTLKALFVPALHLEQEWMARLLELAQKVSHVESVEPEEKAAPNNLPASLTTFIGREKEQSEITRLIDKHRLVTIIGSGGVGKTRISMKVGERVLRDFADGIWLVELAPLSDPDLLAHRVASALGIAIQSTIPQAELLVNFLRAKSSLLILDNCEHLLDACAQLTDMLLKHCPHLKILTTSREALGILGETQYRLPSLGSPDIQQTLERYREYESIRLFEERAQLAQADFRLTMENAASIARICARLDGIPLAIELAAARVDMFSIQEIAARLDGSFSLLTGVSRTGLPRQQTIRASIDWSWCLISDPERALLRRLTVFAGGWTLEAAEAICSVDGVESNEVLELMSRLVAKSLVIVNKATERETRFSCHETIRQYAHEKLIEAGEGEKIRRQHLKYFLKLSELAESALHGPQQKEWFERMNDELGNIRVALEDASRTDLEAGLFLCGRLIYFWDYSDIREGLRWATEFLQKPESKTHHHARAKALLARGHCLWYLQQFEAARSQYEESVTLFRTCGDRQGEFDSLIAMGGAAQFLEGMKEGVVIRRQTLDLARSIGDVWREAIALESLGWDARDPRLSRAYWEQSIGLYRQLGDWRSLGQTLGILGYTVLSNGDIESARKFLDEAAEVNQRTNDRRGMEFVLTGRSQMALMRGEYEQARSFLQEWVVLAEELGNRMGYLWARARMGNVALCEGNVAEARAILIDVVESFHKDRNKNGLAFTLDKMADMHNGTGQYESAARLIGWSDVAREELGDPRPLLEQADVDRVIDTIVAEIGSSAFEDAYDYGRGMNLDEAIALALEVKN